MLANLWRHKKIKATAKCFGAELLKDRSTIKPNKATFIVKTVIGISSSFGRKATASFLFFLHMQ